MRVPQRTIFALAAASLLVFGACGDDAGSALLDGIGDEGRDGRETGDGTGGAGTDGEGTDGEGGNPSLPGVEIDEDAGSDDTPAPGCDRSGFAMQADQFVAEQGGATYQAVSSDAAPFDVLLVQIFDDFGGPTGPGTYSLDGINYADCGLCLLAQADCQDEQCTTGTLFYASEGSVTIEELGTQEGQRFRASFSDVVFEEVTIAEGTFRSTPVANGEAWCMDDHSISTLVGGGGGATGDCNEAQYDCVGETVSNFSLMSCETGEMVEFHDINSSSIGTWLMMSAGWCSACHATIPQVFDILDTDLAGEDMDYIIVVGEDDNFEPADLAFCRDQYAPRYGQGTSNFYVDPGFETIFSNVWIYPDASGQFGLPWSGMFRGGSNQFVYGDGDGQGDVNTGLNLLLNP